MPSEEVATMLLNASERMPGEPYLRELDRRIQAFNLIVDDIRRTAREVSKVRIRVRYPNHTNNPWRWFAGGVIVALIILLVGVVIGLSGHWHGLHQI